MMMVEPALLFFTDKLRQLRARYRIIRDHGHYLNQRARVEQHLHDCAAGKRPLPNARECRKLALRLGILNGQEPSA